MAGLLEAFDWSRTPIGPLEQWPANLRTVVNILLAQQFPMALLWGRDLILIYNDAYRVICGNKHPRALGCSTREIWPEVWHINQPIFAAVMDHGQTLYFEDKLFPVNRRGQLEDAYFTLCYSPVRIEGGGIGGALVVLEETTERRKAQQELLQAHALLEERVRVRTAELEQANEALRQEIAERRRTEQALRMSEERFRHVFTNDMVPMAIWKKTGSIVEANEAFLKMIGYTRADLEAGMIRWDEITPHDYIERDLQAVREVEEKGHCTPYEKAFRHKDGHLVPILIGGGRFDDPAGAGIFFAVDLTESKRAEAERAALEVQLRETQKMETVGRLAGGMAHEFNNLLQGIMGHTELCRFLIAPDHPLGAHLNEIDVSSLRAVNLIRKLLGFARKQIIMPRRFDLNGHVAEFMPLLRTLIRETIDLIWMPGDGHMTVKMDASQVDQILVNLAANACDAIRGTGRITIATAATSLGASCCAAHRDALQGDYAMLTFSDTGCGMEEEIRSHVFEPFFTTKEVGKGTGMGLATVHGIVHQNNGCVTVESQPGRGTTFRIYLPLFAGEPVTAQVAEPPAAVIASSAAPARQRRETILLVDDDPTVLKIEDTILHGLGYTVLVAGSPEEALRLEAEHSGAIDLLLTDVIMPGRNGRELADRLIARRPQLKCIFMSGHTADIVAQHGILEEKDNFLAKPFSREELSNKLREVLNRSDSNGGVMPKKSAG